MIGDFLRYKQDFPNTRLYGKIVKVCGIRGRVDVITIDDGKYHASEHPNWLEPIPITPEILEKNGFERERNNDNILVYCEDGEVVYYEFGKYYGITVDNSLAQIRELKVRHVHQLQQVLRLAGVEKEIEL